MNFRLMFALNFIEITLIQSIVTSLCIDDTSSSLSLPFPAQAESALVSRSTSDRCDTEKGFVFM